MTQTTSRVNEYRERGWSPIPLKIRSKEPKLPKEHPFLRRKPTEEEFNRFDFRHNVGIVTGRVSRLVVLDDDDNGETLRKNGWHVPATPTVKTKRGWQYYLRCPADGFPTCDLDKKVEVRGDGAYVVAPPSIHPSGERYEWTISPHEATLAEMPGWMFEAAAAAKTDGGHNGPIDMAAVLEGVAKGERDKTLFRTSARLRGAGVPYAFARKLILEAAANCTPPFPEREAIKKVASAYGRYEPNKNGRNSHSHSRIGDVNVNEGENGSVHHPKKHLRAISFVGRAKPPPQEFVVEKIIPCGMATSFYGGGGLAKSVNVLHLGMSVAFNGIEDWHGLRVMTCPVIFLDFEMSETVQLRRAKEIADGEGWPDTPQNFHYVEAGGYSTADVFRFALELVEKHGPSLVIVDSFGFSMQGQSEASSDVLSYARDYLQPLQDTGSHPLIVDHISRAIKGERAADKEAFGSVYKTNSMRSTVNVTGHADQVLGQVYATFTHRKSNVGPKLEPFTVITKFSGEEITFERSDTVIHPPTEETIEQLVVSAIREQGPMTNKQISVAIDRDLRSVQNTTSRLKSAGVLAETGEKVDREAVLGLAAS